MGSEQAAVTGHESRRATPRVPLSASTRSSWGDLLPGPEYDRTKVTTGVVHIGVGAFHRAHQALYHDRLMNEGKALDWGICGVGVLASDRKMQEALTAQDCLYTVVEKHADGNREARVVGAITEYLFAPDDAEAVVEKMAAEPTRIVSLTITEGGYELDPDAGPRTTFGLITEALSRRRHRGLAPFTVMSCDNLEGNGDRAKRAVTGFARLRDEELSDWVERHVPFPNSTVDRITPATTDADRAEVTERFGIEDRWPVVCEPFTQWVLEDRFGAGRPPYEDVGVQVVDDVEPYELMKLRLLNASHQALAYFAYLCGFEFAHEAALDPLFRAFLLGYMNEEATPTLPPVPGVDLDDYKHTLIERFSNPELRDTVARLCAESSDRIPKWLLPVIRAQLATDGEITRSAAVVASWARYAEGVDEHGEPIEVVDRLKDSLMQSARRQREHPNAFIENRDVFGDLVDDERFVVAYRRALDSLHEHGARATLEWLTTPESP
jgi:mannitol 2-dehydrogenase